MSLLEYNHALRVDLDVTPPGWSSAKRSRDAIARAVAAAIEAAHPHVVMADAHELVIRMSSLAGPIALASETLEALRRQIADAVAIAFLDGAAVPVPVQA